MRRGSPSVETQKLLAGGMNGQQGPSFDPVAGVPPQMMYGMGPNGSMTSMHGAPGMPGMFPQMQPPMLSAGEQAQIQMSQQMSQFMQMQMQFMQMMAGNQNGVPPPMQPPYGGGMPGNQSMGDLSGRQSMIGDFLQEPRRMDGGRTMSMVHPHPSISCHILDMRHPSEALAMDMYRLLRHRNEATSVYRDAIDLSRPCQARRNLRAFTREPVQCLELWTH